jgi:hypothetical protein
MHGLHAQMWTCNHATGQGRTCAADTALSSCLSMALGNPQTDVRVLDRMQRFQVHADEVDGQSKVCSSVSFLKYHTHPPTGPSSWVPSISSSPCAACRASKRA